MNLLVPPLLATSRVNKHGGGVSELNHPPDLIDMQIWLDFSNLIRSTPDSLASSSQNINLSYLYECICAIFKLC